MSMLTPPGLKGKQYRVTGNSYPRLRRPNLRRRYLLLAVTGVAVLTVLGWGTFQLTDVFGGGNGKASAAAACDPKASGQPGSGASGAPARAGASGAAGAPAASGAAGAPGASGAAATAAVPAAAFAVLTTTPKPATITVNVYNATDRAGLASSTAALLKQRGFTIGKIGNAPAALQHKVLGTAEVAGNSAAAQLMTVLGTEVTGAVPVTDLRKDTTVDLILGNGFTALSTPAKAAQNLVLAARPLPVATPHC